MVKAFEQTPTISLTRDKILSMINNIYMRKVGRILFWAVLVCAMILPLVAQVKANSAPLAASASDQQVSAQKCHMADCGCPCCRHTGQKSKSGCRCLPISLLSLHAVGVGAPPVEQNSLSYTAYISPRPPLIITDIYRPPQS